MKILGSNDFFIILLFIWQSYFYNYKNLISKSGQIKLIK